MNVRAVPHGAKALDTFQPLRRVAHGRFAVERRRADVGPACRQPHRVAGRQSVVDAQLDGAALHHRDAVVAVRVHEDEVVELRRGVADLAHAAVMLRAAHERTLPPDVLRVARVEHRTLLAHDEPDPTRLRLRHRGSRHRGEEVPSRIPRPKPSAVEPERPLGTGVGVYSEDGRRDQSAFLQEDFRCRRLADAQDPHEELAAVRDRQPPVAVESVQPFDVRHVHLAGSRHRHVSAFGYVDITILRAIQRTARHHEVAFADVVDEVRSVDVQRRGGVCSLLPVSNVRDAARDRQAAREIDPPDDVRPPLARIEYVLPRPVAGKRHDRIRAVVAARRLFGGDQALDLVGAAVDAESHGRLGSKLDRPVMVERHGSRIGEEARVPACHEDVVRRLARHRTVALVGVRRKDGRTLKVGGGLRGTLPTGVENPAGRSADVDARTAEIGRDCAILADGE